MAADAVAEAVLVPMAADSALAPMPADSVAEAVLAPMAADAVAETVLGPAPVALPPVAADAAGTALAPTPMAADAAETVLAPAPVAASPIAADAAETNLAPPIAADAAEASVAAADDADTGLAPQPTPVDAAETVPLPVPRVVAADDAEDVAPVPVAPPTEQASQSVTHSGEEEPSQGEINKANKCIDALLPWLADNQKSCGTVGCIAERNQCMEDGNSLSMVNRDGKSPEIPSVRSAIDQEAYLMAVSDEDSRESENQHPTSSLSDQQQNPTLCFIGNEETQNVSCSESNEKQALEMTRKEMWSRGLIAPPTLEMRNWYGEDRWHMCSRIGRNNDIYGLSDHATRISSDLCDHSDGNDHTDDGDVRHRMYRVRDNRCGCPCHCNDPRFHGDGGRPWRRGFINPHNQMDIYPSSDHSPTRISSDQSDHIDENDHTDDGDVPDPIFHGMDNRCGCPRHYNDPRFHRDGGNWWARYINPHSRMAFGRWYSSKLDPEHWSFPKLDREKERYNVGAALFNPQRWTCFLNCILQCMVHTVPLVLKLQKADHPDPCPRDSAGFCCYCSLKLHADESIRLSGSAFYPESFVERLSSISPDFEIGVQQDAQELLRCLLDKLDEASAAHRSMDESSSAEENGLAKEVFGGRLKSQLHCPECNHCSDRFEPFLDLSLEVNTVDTLIDALESFTKVELIEDVMCDGCKSRVNMEKHLKVEQAPDVLVIHLKRFLNSGHNISKIWDKVKYPLELDIDPFMCCADDAPHKYDLYGVVEHLGPYARGHYVCYIRSSQADWYKFDDDRVYRYSEDDVLNSTSYLLFYVKQGSSPWFSTLLKKDNTSDLKNKEKESMTSLEQDCSDPCLSGPAEENGNGPCLPELSEHSQRNESGNALSDAPEELLEGSLVKLSGGTQEFSSVTGSSDKNGHVDGCTEPLGTKENGRPLLDSVEMNGSTQGSSEVDSTGTQGGSPGNNDNTTILPQGTSHKHEDNCHPTDSFFHEDQMGGSSGDFWVCSSEKETKSNSNKEIRNGNDGISKGGGEEGGAGKKRKRRKRLSDCESKAGGGERKRKQRAEARPRGRRSWFAAGRWKKRRR